jgi:superfamily I DNA and/or RNA helicase
MLIICLLQNEVEASHILHLARKLEERDQKYRIITGYEDQRNLIENLMREEGLEWRDKCFNIDSFQGNILYEQSRILLYIYFLNFNYFTGNEEDFIIISIVRTLKLGFLKDIRRTNVMLSRCKKGMFIVSKPHFLTEIAKDSLIGWFVEKISNRTWLTLEDVRGNEFWENEF